MSILHVDRECAQFSLVRSAFVIVLVTRTRPDATTATTRL